MPYGVCSSACGHTAFIARSVSMGTGAPADITSRTLLSALVLTADAVASTLASAAGEANTMVA